MLKGDWFRHPALGVAAFAVIALSIAALNPNPHPIYSKRAHNCSEDQLSDPASRCFVLESALHYPPAYSDEYRSQKDLEAQQGMAFWAMLMFFITATGVWLVAQTLVETREATRAAIKTADITRKIGEAQTRAYLSIEKIRIKYTKEPGLRKVDEQFSRATFDIVLRINNSGNSPANNIEMDFAIDERTGLDFPSPPFQKTMRQEVAASIPAKGTYDHKTGMSLTIENGLLGHKTPIDVKDRNRKLLFVGALIYTDVFDKRWRFDLICQAAPFFLSNEFNYETMKFKEGEGGFYTTTDFSRVDVVYASVPRITDKNDHKKRGN